MKKCKGYVVYQSDSVGTALEELVPGSLELLGDPGQLEVCVNETIPSGHKFAIRDISVGAPIYKYGGKIGTATADIRKGEHVHLHNIRSDFDVRSSTLDTVTAASTDVDYLLYESTGGTR